MKKTLQKGFTLIEAMLYIALLAILLGGAFLVVNQLLVDGGKNQMAVSVQEEGTFLIRKMNWALTGATQAIVSQQGKVISITRPNLGSESPLVIDGSGQAFSIKRGVGNSMLLNGSFFAISDAKFELIDSGVGVATSFKVQGTPFSFKKYFKE